MKHGNEDTVREMLRIKRSVSHTYNTSVNMMSAQMLGQASSGTVSDLAPGMKDDMRMLEAKAAEMNAKADAVKAAAASAPVNLAGNVMFVRGEKQSKAVEEAAKEPAVNPDEIDLDDDDVDESSSGGEDEEPKEKPVVGGVEKQAIPTKVFGGLKNDEDD